MTIRNRQSTEDVPPGLIITNHSDSRETPVSLGRGDGVVK